MLNSKALTFENKIHINNETFKLTITIADEQNKLFNRTGYSHYANKTLRFEFPKKEDKLQEALILQHEIGHLYYKHDRWFGIGRKKVIQQEKQAWQYVTKKLGKSKLIGELIATHFITYLFHCNMLKNKEFWKNRLEHYSNLTGNNLLGACKVK